MAVAADVDAAIDARPSICHEDGVAGDMALDSRL
jgi:hypothetical protein